MRGGAVALVVALLLHGAAAEARVMDLRAGLRAGGMVGWGTRSNTPDFFEKTRGGGAGFEIGFKLLVFDFSANFFQVLDSSGTAGTLTQLLFGTVIDIPVGRLRLRDGDSRQILRPAVAGGFGFGTPGPVDPPLNAAQISDKGLLANFKMEYEFFLNPFMAVGAQALFGYHHFIFGSDVATNSSGYHLMGLATFNFHLGF
jgi:hypothetical protein